MASDGTIAQTALVDLARFEAKTSADGRLLYYARGRIRAFRLRQTLTAIGAVTIAVLASSQLGAFLAGVALMGETFDIIVLRHVIRLLEGGTIGRRPRNLAILGAGVQGMTIAACIAVTWQSLPIHEGRFFAAAFLISAGINAGMVRAHFRAAADLRLGIFMVTAFVMMAMDLTQSALASSREYAFFAAGFGMLIYISVLFINLMEQNYKQRRSHEYTVLKHQQQREVIQQELAERAGDSQRLALVAKYANDSIVISAPSGCIEWVNDAFTRITGYGFAEAVGKFPADLLDAPETDPAALNKLQHARDNQVPARVELLNLVKSGRRLWMETSINPVFDGTGQLQLWIAVERDITMAKERELELARARAAAEEAGHSKSRFLANMSHEIRTPMNGVIGVAELLSETRMTATQAQYVGTILESGQALLAIINDVLDLARLQSGKAKLDPLPFSLRACAESVLRILGPAADKKGLQLRLVAPDADRLVLGDEGKLRQILLNLVGNAVKFTLDGSVTLTVVPPADGSGPTRIEVADTGIGITAERTSSIFDSFSQADDGINRRFGGTGLGLTICAMLAAQMGGSIGVTSEIGQGSVFTVEVPLPPAPSGLIAEFVADRRARIRVLPGLTIMVAEDNRTNMMIVRKMLADTAGSLIEAVNGEEAVSYYQKGPPDLILMDISMPVKDGLLATREIRAHETRTGLPPCPILALTANAFGEDREACRAAGFDGFLVKPLSRHDLLSAISQHWPAGPHHPKVIGL
ncbi:MAG: ATP-binding protein [bacterium]